MRSDNALLLLIKSEIARGVLSGNLRMMVAMQLVSVRMPVIQEIIMQKCGAYESSLIASRMKRTVQCECGLPRMGTGAMYGASVSTSRRPKGMSRMTFKSFEAFLNVSGPSVPR